jgi:hypothetical protein
LAEELVKAEEGRPALLQKPLLSVPLIVARYSAELTLIGNSEETVGEGPPE